MVMLISMVEISGRIRLQKLETPFIWKIIIIIIAGAVLMQLALIHPPQIYTTNLIFIPEGIWNIHVII